MQRIYHTDLSPTITLDKEHQLYHQLVRVLRMQCGDTFIMFDGSSDVEYVYQIERIERSSLVARKGEARSSIPVPKKCIVLCQALPNRFEKVEYIVQKCVEVGVEKIYFFRSDRSQKLVISDQKKDRIRSIMIEAVEQCGASRLVDIVFLENFQSCYLQNKEAPMIVFDTIENDPHGSVLSHEACSLWVGPEGGWSEEERKKITDYGFISVRFGERVLRTETAGAVGVFLLQHARTLV